MSARGRAVLAGLESLGHLDLLDAPDTHSRHDDPEPEEAQRLFDQGLGRRRLSVFRALHRPRLEAWGRSLSAGRLDAEDFEARGRVRRLLGLVDEADADFVRAGTRRAASWRGEALIYTRPGEALRLFRATRAQGDPWPSFWSGVALMKAIRHKDARAPLEEAALQFGAEAPHVFWLVLYQARVHAKDLTGARAALNRALSLDAASPAPCSLLGHLAHIAGEPKEEMARFHAARNLDMDVAGSYLFEGLGLDLTWGEPRAYLDALERAIVRRPRCGALYAERAELLRDPRFCRYEDAIRDYEKAALLEPKVAWIRATLARARNKAGNARAGLVDFDRAAKLAPNSGWIRAWRGAALSRAGRLPAALRDFAAAEAVMPWYSFTYAWRGAVFVRLKRWESACADLDRAVELDPHYLFSRNERFRARLGRGDYEGAVSDLNACFQADPKYTWLGRSGTAAMADLDAAARARPRLGWVRAWRGFSLLELGRVREAPAEFAAAARLLPGEPLIRAWRARALAVTGNTAQARREYSACLRLDPSLWNAHKGLADLDAAEGRWKDAHRRLRRVTELTPTTVAAFFDAAAAGARLGRDREALGDLARALELDPDYREAALLSAELRLRQGELDMAQTQLEAVFRRPAPPARAFAARGMLQQARGDERAAVQDFRRAYELDPGVFPPEVREVVKKLSGGRDE